MVICFSSLGAEALLVDMKPARNAIPGFRDNLITHSGPPISWEKMLKVQKMAVINAIISEGLAETPEQAEKLVDRQEILVEYFIN